MDPWTDGIRHNFVRYTVITNHLTAQRATQLTSCIVLQNRYKNATKTFAFWLRACFINYRTLNTFQNALNQWFLVRLGLVWW